jgi:hypothetical protein
MSGNLDRRLNRLEAKRHKPKPEPLPSVEEWLRTHPVTIDSMMAAAANALPEHIRREAQRLTESLTAKDEEVREVGLDLNAPDEPTFLTM